MLQNVFLQGNLRANNSNQTSQDHSNLCPYCKCKSPENSATIKVHSKPACNFKILLGKDFLDKKTKYSKTDQRFQNVYYRSFQSPRKRGLSPNGSKKIVIQYSSPEHYLQSSRIYNPLFKQASSKNLQSSNILNSSSRNISRSPRNIYTNQNTPPKARFLQRRSSRKNSQDRINFQTPVQGLALVQSQRVRIPVTLNEPTFVIPNQYQKLTGQIQKGFYKERQISPIGRIKDVSQIPITSRNNLIQSNSSPRNSASPFNSLAETTPNVVPYGSFPSTPLINDSSSKRINPSLGEIQQFRLIQSQPKLYKNEMQVVNSKNNYIVLKKNQSPQKQYRYNYQKFDKTLGKPKSVPRISDGDLNYTQSDQKSLTNQNPSNNNIYKNYVGQNLHNGSQSQQNIRPFSERQKHRINMDIVEISDNFQTPKSKYKGMKNMNIRYGQNSGQNNTITDNFVRQISPLTIQDKVKGQNSQSRIQNGQNTGHSSSSLGPMSKIKQKQDQIKPYKAQQITSPNQISIPKIYEIKPNKQQEKIATYLQEQLKLNYDYYEMKPSQQLNPYLKDKSNNNKQQYYNFQLNQNNYQNSQNNMRYTDNQIKDQNYTKRGYNSSIQEQSLNKSIDLTF